MKRKLIIIMFIILIVVFFKPLSFSNYNNIAIASEKSRDILILHSYDMDYDWTKNINDGIKSVITYNKDVSLFYYYMESKRFDSNEYYEELYKFFKSKYSRIKFEVIICSDNNALSFLLKYKDSLFPSTPVVFCGVNSYDENFIECKKDYTGVVEHINVPDTINIIKKLQPEKENIIVITENSESGKLVKKNIMNQSLNFNNVFNFTYYSDIYISNIKNISDNEVILYAGGLLNSSGIKISYVDGLDLLKKYNVPIYSLWDFTLNHNTVGGMMVDGLYQGKVAGKLALKILDGEDVSNIPVISESPNTYMFDYKELKRFKIDMSKIPKGSIIINKPPSIYKEHKIFVITIITLIIFLGTIAILLIFLNRNKRISSKKVQDSYMELSAVYEELAATEESLRNQYTILQENEEQLRISEERYRLALDGAKDIIWDLNIIENKLITSDKWMEITGFDSKTKMETLDDWLLLIHPSDLMNLKNIIANLKLDNKTYLQSEYRIRTKDGSYKWIYCRAKALRDESSNITRAAGSITDITERKANEEKILNLAYIDSLTKLPNRRMFMEKLTDKIENPENKGKKCALIFADIDNFKNINDTLGHDFGDMVLKEVSLKLKYYSFDNIIISRFGGDEFCILYYDIESIESPRKLCRMIMESLKRPLNINGHKIYITMSMGIAIYPDNGEDTVNLLKNADTALYISKESGKNRFTLYEESMRNKVVKKTMLQNGLRQALANNEFILHYQPQVDAKTGKILGFEALLRWMHPSDGIISPMDFIPIAEETGLIIPIGNWVINTAFKKVKELTELNLYFEWISINISGVQLKEPNFLESIKNAVKSIGIAPEKVQFEITETVLVESYNRTINILNELSGMGFKIAIDDFGRGYSNFSCLVNMPINSIKIDKSFIDNLEINPKQKSIAEGIIILSHKIDLDIIAEGVENKCQLEFLRKNNCNKIQGYYFSKPITEDKIVELLQIGYFEV